VAMEFPGPVVDAEWVRRALEEPGSNLVLADARWYPDRPRRAGYLEGHIPGAVYVDVDEDLAAPVPPDRRGGRHPLPTPQAFAGAMSRLGIGDDTPVVAYDDAGGSTAARLWWMLWALGHPVAMLDGGLHAWPGPREAGEGRIPPRAVFTSRPWPREAMVDAEQIERLRTEPGTALVDVRTAERFRGEREPIDPVAGHIPGARNVPWVDHLDSWTGCFRSAEELRLRYAEAGVGDATAVIAQCGSGVTACIALVALEVAGLPAGRLYVGSWSDWISDPSRAVAVGEI